MFFFSPLNLPSVAHLENPPLKNLISFLAGFPDFQHRNPPMLWRIPGKWDPWHPAQNGTTLKDGHGLNHQGTTFNWWDDPSMCRLLKSCILNLLESFWSLPSSICNQIPFEWWKQQYYALDHTTGKATRISRSKKNSKKMTDEIPPGCQGWNPQGTRSTATARISTWRTGSSRLRHRTEREGLIDHAFML